MAFLDNSGDIILDAVITDSGRARLAKGNGTFNITKFALGDDEVNYTQFQNSNHPTMGAHPSGTLYYDLEILQTPVFEAFTNNTSFLKSKLVTYLTPDLLYLPVLRVNDLASNSKMHSALNAYVVAVDKDTRDIYSTVSAGGVLDGFEPLSSETSIRLDQGIHNDDFDVPPTEGPLSGDQLETQYIVEIDNRLGSLVRPSDASSATPSFIDDDSIASYYFTLTTDPGYVTMNNITENAELTEVIRGPRGTTLTLRIKSTLDVRRSNFLFDQIGAEGTLVDINGTATSVRFIDTTIKVSGATTGFRVDIPVRFLKKQ